MVSGLFDLNTVNNEDETAMPASSYSPSSSVASGNFESVFSSTSSSAVLWRACAGPLISLPKKGRSVVYFPQGHVEHPATAYDLPPHVFCRVIDLKLHADAASDEVYAQVSLVPDQQIERKWREGIVSDAEDEDPEGVGKSLTPHMFCKTLTASDTSTHGGFSVPRRAAEDCFPPLDYRQQRPSQELVAKDLHGTEWKFRHIYRGQPRRHLLTTGWSAFVNKKKLISGDAVLFLRGGDGELRLGIRRAAQDKCGGTILPPNSQRFGASSIAAVVNAISMSSAFNICYNPRARSSDIIIPYQKFSRSLSHSFSCGMRFKIRSETDDSSERSGLIVGISDVDPTRWPGSKWKCLLVRWDGMEVNRINRVSPWEIGSLSVPNSLLLPGTKRSRVGFTSVKPDLPAPLDGTQVSDFGEPLRFQKVLQGQEVFGFSNPYMGMEASRLHQTDMRSDPDPSMLRHIEADARSSLQRAVLGESFQFHKALQGQETMSIMSYGRGSETSHVRGKNVAADGIQFPGHGTSWSTRTQVYNTGSHPVSGSSPSSVLVMQQFNPPPSHFRPLHYGNQDSLHVPQRIPGKFPTSESIFMRGGLPKFRSTRGIEDHSQMAFPQCPILSQPQDRNNQKFVSTCKNSCRLFGFSLTGDEGPADQGEGPIECASAYDPESNSSPRNEEELYQPPLTTKVMASSCTKGTDMHTMGRRSSYGDI